MNQLSVPGHDDLYPAPRPEIRAFPTSHVLTCLFQDIGTSSEGEKSAGRYASVQKRKLHRLLHRTADTWARWRTLCWGEHGTSTAHRHWLIVKCKLFCVWDKRRLLYNIFKSNIVVVMEKCWGTPISDRENKLRYYMIQDGCPVNGDTSLNVKSNGDSLQGRFDIKMFKFIGEDLNDVWLHCTGRYFITSIF